MEVRPPLRGQQHPTLRSPHSQACAPWGTKGIAGMDIEACMICIHFFLSKGEFNRRWFLSDLKLPQFLGFFILQVMLSFPFSHWQTISSLSLFHLAVIHPQILKGKSIIK